MVKVYVITKVLVELALILISTVKINIIYKVSNMRRTAVHKKTISSSNKFNHRSRDC
jgi:hypothetical protein